jgi:hypothetical protein
MLLLIVLLIAGASCADDKIEKSRQTASDVLTASAAEARYAVCLDRDEGFWSESYLNSQTAAIDWNFNIDTVSAAS